MSALYPLVLLLKGNKGNDIRETKRERIQSPINNRHKGNRGLKAIRSTHDIPLCVAQMLKRVLELGLHLAMLFIKR